MFSNRGLHCMFGCLPLTSDHQIIFDECHKAKNATSTKMGKAVLDLQNKLPLARVVYASATGRLTQIYTENNTRNAIQIRML